MAIITTIICTKPGIIAKYRNPRKSITSRSKIDTCKQKINKYNEMQIKRIESF